MWCGSCKALDKFDPQNQLTDMIEEIKARVRAKVKYPCLLIKRQFGYVKTRYLSLEVCVEMIVKFRLSMVDSSKIKGRKPMCVVCAGAKGASPSRPRVK